MEGRRATGWDLGVCYKAEPRTNSRLVPHSGKSGWSLSELVYFYTLKRKRAGLQFQEFVQSQGRRISASTTEFLLAQGGATGCVRLNGVQISPTCGEAATVRGSEADPGPRSGPRSVIDASSNGCQITKSTLLRGASFSAIILLQLLWQRVHEDMISDSGTCSRIALSVGESGAARAHRRPGPDLGALAMAHRSFR